MPSDDALSELDPIRAIAAEGDAWILPTVPTAHGGVYGAHQLFQQVLVAELATPGKRVLSLQTAFSSGGAGGQPMRAEVERLSEGRSFAFLRLRFTQGELVISETLVMTAADEPDFIRVELPPAAPLPVEDWADDRPLMFPGRNAVPEGAGLDRVERLLELPAAEADQGLARALIAMASEPPLMGALLAALPRLSPSTTGTGTTNVLTQSLAFLEPLPLGEGVVMRVDRRWAGGSRVHGTGEVLARDGRLLATFGTTGVMRPPRGA